MNAPPLSSDDRAKGFTAMMQAKPTKAAEVRRAFRFRRKTKNQTPLHTAIALGRACELLDDFRARMEAAGLEPDDVKASLAVRGLDPGTAMTALIPMRPGEIGAVMQHLAGLRDSTAIGVVFSQIDRETKNKAGEPYCTFFPWPFLTDEKSIADLKQLVKMQIRPNAGKAD